MRLPVEWVYMGERAYSALDHQRPVGGQSVRVATRCSELPITSQPRHPPNSDSNGRKGTHYLRTAMASRVAGAVLRRLAHQQGDGWQQPKV